MANEQNLIPFSGKDDPRRAKGKPKGAIHLSTRIKNMRNDDEFTTELVQKDGKKIEFKGNPAEAIIRTAVLKAMSGDKQWADWLAQNGYGKSEDGDTYNVIQLILNKYGGNSEGIINEVPRPETLS